MGMVVAYQDNAMPLPNGVQREQLELFKNVVKNGVSTIGVGKKCCWCCSRLAKLLPNVSFEIAASHGLMFQWALPTIGISMGVAEAMERALSEIWHKEVDRFAEGFEKRARKEPQSAMSSPSGSIPFEDSMLDDVNGKLTEWVL